MHIDLFGFPGSTYTRTARIACMEKDIAFTLHPLDFGGESHLALHPFGKMPVMRHGDVTLFEAAAIAFYIDHVADGPRLQPSDMSAQACMWQWISAGIDYFYDAFVRSLLAHGDAAGQPHESMVPRKTCLSALNEALRDSDYLSGDALSIADLIVAPMISYYAGADGQDALLNDGRVARWLAALETRESFRATA